MINYIHQLTKDNKLELFNEIINILKEHNIKYRINKHPKTHLYGNIIVEYNHYKRNKVVVVADYDNKFVDSVDTYATSCSMLMNLILNYKGTKDHYEFVFLDMGYDNYACSKDYLKRNKKYISSMICLNVNPKGPYIIYHSSEDIDVTQKGLGESINKYQAYKSDLYPYHAFSFVGKGITLFSISNAIDIEYLNAIPTFNIPTFGEDIPSFNRTVEEPDLKSLENLYQFTLDVLSHLIFGNNMRNALNSLIDMGSEDIKMGTIHWDDIEGTTTLKKYSWQCLAELHANLTLYIGLLLKEFAKKHKTGCPEWCFEELHLTYQDPDTRTYAKEDFNKARAYFKKRVNEVAQLFIDFTYSNEEQKDVDRMFDALKKIYLSLWD